MAHANDVDFGRRRPWAAGAACWSRSACCCWRVRHRPPTPDLTKADELLQAGQAAEAAVLFEQALEADPSSVAAHLGLGRAYYALGEYARARIEFETVLQYDNLPRDLHGQTEVYDQAAEDYAAGREWRPFYYAETGIGNYRENTSSSTDIFGGAGDHDTFLPIRVGGGWNKSMTERHSFNGTLDYRFRTYDESGRRNDSDLRWNLNISRPVDDDNLRFGMRGRASYRGDGQYRNDWGVFADYRVGLGDNDQVTHRRRGARAQVPERSAAQPHARHRRTHRQLDALTGKWPDVAVARRATDTGMGDAGPAGRGRLVLGRQWRDRSLVQRLARRLLLVVVRQRVVRRRTSRISAPIPTCSRSATTTCGISAAALVWGFASGWSLRPTFEYNWEDSSIDSLAYSSTELWLTVRKSF